jgi:hypothetical protein
MSRRSDPEADALFCQRTTERQLEAELDLLSGYAD